MSFEDIERIVGARLPQSAFNHRAWWSNNPTNSVMTKAWLSAGFRSEEVDMTARKLVFSRHLPNVASGGATRVAPASTGSPLAGLFGGLKGTVHIEPGTDLTLPSTAPVYLYEGGETDSARRSVEPLQEVWPSRNGDAELHSPEEFNPSLGVEWPEDH
nr:hypothetical protein [Ancylobacter aquaticus]